MLVCVTLFHIAFFINNYFMFGVYIILFGVTYHHFFPFVDNTFHFSSLQLEVLF